jgi:pantothenate kinase
MAPMMPPLACPGGDCDLSAARMTRRAAAGLWTRCQSSGAIVRDSGPIRCTRPSGEEDTVDLDELTERARRLCSGPGRRVLGITGPPGVGKTTLVEALLARLRTPPAPGQGAGGTAYGRGDWVAHVPMDGFHLADVQLERLGLRDRKGAPETFDAGGYLSLLQRFVSDEPRVLYAPGFERELEQPLAAAIAIPPSTRLLLTEGNYLLLPEGDWPAVRELLDAVWYVELGERERVRRLVDRHVAFGKSPREAASWVERTDEANSRLVAATRARADLVVNEW